MEEHVVSIGRMNTLQVVSRVEVGMFMDGKGFGKILLPKRYVPDGAQVGDFLDVFLYLDSEDRLIATTETPYAMEGEFAYLKVVSNTNVGSFLDWGLTKDLLVPFREKREKLVVGEYCMVYVYLDEKSKRLAASTKVHKFMRRKEIHYSPGDSVDLIICSPFELGYNVIIDRSFVGAIYGNEVFRPLRGGQQVRGFIKEIRPDGKIDAELQKPGDSRDALTDKILAYLKANDGFCAVSDNSPPATIYQQFHASKKAYKRAIGGLYKQQVITIRTDGIRLN